MLSVFAIRNDIDQGLLAEVEVTDLDLSRDLIAVWSRSTQLNASTRCLLEVIAAAQARRRRDLPLGPRH